MPPANGKILTCPNCKKEFYRCKSRIKEGSQSFCSIACANHYLHSDTQKTVCANCKNELVLPSSRLKRSKNNFCNNKCANEFQGKNKAKFTCTTCQNKFEVSASQVEKSSNNGHKILYCSIKCRNSDKERMTQKAQVMNKIQLEKKGLNKLELAGREWLEGMGFVNAIDFEEQVLLFDKFCVDVEMKKYKLVVQFDGEYWHSKQKRARLDESQDAYLRKCGYKIFRITDKELYSKDTNLHKVLIERWINCLI